MDNLIEEQARLIKQMRAALHAAQAAGNFQGHIGEMAMHAINAAMKLSEQYDDWEKQNETQK